MTKKQDLLNLFKQNVGKTTTTAGVTEERGQANIRKKYGYQPSNLREFFR